jgi:hypothetical protein
MAAQIPTAKTFVPSGRRAAFASARSRCTFSSVASRSGAASYRDRSPPQAAMAGVPTKTIKELAGHTSITTGAVHAPRAGLDERRDPPLEAASSFGRILADAPAASETAGASRL